MEIRQKKYSNLTKMEEQRKLLFSTSSIRKFCRIYQSKLRLEDQIKHSANDLYIKSILDSPFQLFVRFHMGFIPSLWAPTLGLYIAVFVGAFYFRKKYRSLIKISLLNITFYYWRFHLPGIVLVKLLGQLFFVSIDKQKMHFLKTNNNLIKRYHKKWTYFLSLSDIINYVFQIKPIEDMENSYYKPFFLYSD